MLEFVKDDIFNLLDDNTVLVHQVNCKGVMGCGIAKRIKDTFPETFYLYKLYCEKISDILGQILLTNETYKGKHISIANCFGQYSYGRDKCYTDYVALRNCFKKLSESIETHNTILIPYKMGCSSAGGDWQVVEAIISKELSNHKVKIVQFDK